MTTRLLTDAQFERAFLSYSTVYVRDKARQTPGRIGSLDGFNPLFVTVSGDRCYRSDYDFLVTDLQ